MTAKRARKALQGPGVVVMYSSGELGIVDWGGCTRGSARYYQGPTHGITYQIDARMCLVS